MAHINDPQKKDSKRPSGCLVFFLLSLTFIVVILSGVLKYVYPPERMPLPPGAEMTPVVKPTLFTFRSDTKLFVTPGEEVAYRLELRNHNATAFNPPHSELWVVLGDRTVFATDDCFHTRDLWVDGEWIGPGTFRIEPDGSLTRISLESDAVYEVEGSGKLLKLVAPPR